ncbi:hypothetical protein NNQ28_10625 [Cronobacter dublinensis]|uniref:hypothetical protein n=1 Tax=Cronobacter dublinensis TaxID=413497 RepID=UPI00292DA8BF|nr:hypothetical protein [Cronobacter dublinensis]WNY84779.1 hypothetical protein NNQ28_10625 [Cronobacter dublinensis]
MTLKKEIPKNLMSAYNMVFNGFGDKISQHEYEGLIVLLYEEMSDENLSKLLSYFIDKEPIIIHNDIAKYYKNDKELYMDVKVRLDNNDYANWLDDET